MPLPPGKRAGSLVSRAAGSRCGARPSAAPGRRRCRRGTWVLALSPDGTGGARLQVRDGGPGLTDEDVAVAFERGALTARYRGVRPVGSGLGLAIAHRLTSRLGAAITAEGHAPEGGACFTVRLPRLGSLNSPR
ncbi:ATP-binding protein [Streptomyces sp. NPDC001982]|uniref:sensor histidine kinase n=1 Tax=unclassified Streptomyces TaxID=2593676 RepID=UPI00332509F0